MLFLNSYEQSTLSLPVVKLDSEKGTPSFLNGDLRLHLKDLRTSNTLSALPLNMQSRLTSMGMKSLSQASQRESLFQIMRYEIGNLKNRVKADRVRVVPDIYFAKKNTSIENSTTSLREEFQIRYVAGRFKNNLRKYYEKKQQLFEESKFPNYIFVPLHYQPERSTLPLGGLYADTVFLISQLSKAAPAGWKVIVKEHPMQWSYFKKGEQGRSIEDYAKILKLSNTILVPINTPSAQLIKSARLVCTIAGSSGWEAVNQLIPYNFRSSMVRGSARKLTSKK